MRTGKGTLGLVQLFLYPDNHVGDDSRQSSGCNAGREYISDGFGELHENVGIEFYTKSHAETDGNDQSGLAVNVLRGDDFHTSRRHGTEHEQGGSAKHRVGHKGEYYTDNREKSQKHKEQGYEITNVSACHTGKLYHAVVLRKYGIRERIERACNKGVQPVGKNTSLGTLQEGPPLNRLSGNERVGRNVAVCLYGRNHIDNGKGQSLNDTPYLNGTGTLNMEYSGIVLKSTMPQKKETAYPIAMPMIMEPIRK